MNALNQRFERCGKAMYNDVDQTYLKLPAALDHAAAETLLGMLRQRLQGNPTLLLDASEVETLTLPCAQILLAANRGHSQLSIERPSDAFIAAFQDFALDWTEGQAERPEDAPQPGAATVQGEDEARDPNPDQTDGHAMTIRILTIDDSKTIRDMLMLTLSEAGFDVLQAVDGQDGLDVLGKERVDIVITDINMPKMDGYEVIRHLRGHAVHKTTPILVLTTESDTEKKNLAREAGATGWMVKPFDPERLVATVRKVAP
jgi:two-component system, chemotaxis family, chemotaxis protein CheY